MKKVYVGMAAVIEKDEKFLILKRSAENQPCPQESNPAGASTAC